VSPSVDVKRYDIEKIPQLTSAGSGLTYYPIETTSKYTHHFLTVSDGGNAPAILEIKVTKDIAQVVRNIHLNVPSKFDFEGVALAQDGSVWLANEEGPALIKFDLKFKKVAEVLVAGQKLPTVLREMQASRGLEGISISKNKVYAIMQSSLSIHGKSKNALFIRILEYDLSSERIRTFAYPIDEYPESQRSEVQITDMESLDNGHLLVLELSPEYGYQLVDISLEGASDISGILVDGQELEQIEEPLKIFGKPVSKENQVVVPVKKSEILDLKEIGWLDRSAQGLTVLPDGQTVVVSAQNPDGAELWFVRLTKPLAARGGNLVWWLVASVAALLYFKIKK
jgi:hypothetical protein